MCPTTFDVAIVGGGITGLAHAFTALHQGLRVVVLERDTCAVGASIQNFGHLCFTAQADAMLDLTLASREGWRRAADFTHLDVQDSGTLVAARTDAQVTLLANLADRRPDLVKVLDAEAVRSRLGGLGGAVIGGAFLPLDMRANPRRAVSHLAEALAEKGATIQFGTTVHGIEPRGPLVDVETSRGVYRAERVIVCTGHHVGGLFPDVADDGDVVFCRLAMTRVRTPADALIVPAVLTGTSMTRYGAFTETPGIDDVRAELAERSPELVDVVANVMATQLPDGTLIVGDSHHYGSAASPFVDETSCTAVLADFADLLGVESLEVVERWQGVYADSTKQDVLRAEPTRGVEVVTVTAGLGMTLSFGLAEQTLTT